MTLEEMKALATKANEALKEFNAVSYMLTQQGVNVQVEVNHDPVGVVGVGRMEAPRVSAAYLVELD